MWDQGIEADKTPLPTLENQLDSILTQVAPSSPQILRFKPKLVQIFQNADHPLSQDDDLKLLLNMVKILQNQNQGNKSNYEQLLNQNALLVILVEKLVKEVQK